MKIKLIAVDVDGTLTDGKIYCDHQGHRFKKFNDLDRQAVGHFCRLGGTVALLSGSWSLQNQQIADEWGMMVAQNEATPKLRSLLTLCEQLGLSAQQVCFIGDGLNDLEPVQWAGLGVAVADAHPFLAMVADRVSQAKGGDGVVYEICRSLLPEC